MVTFDNYKDQVRSGGDLSFKVDVGDIVLLTSGNKTVRVYARVTNTDMTSTNYRGVINWSDAQHGGKGPEELTEGREIGFNYDEILHVRHPEE